MIDTSNNPAATVLITTKDRKDDLARAIGSVVEQTAPVELIVVDDGSTDGTSELVRDSGHKVFDRDVDVRYQRVYEFAPWLGAEIDGNALLAGIAPSKIGAVLSLTRQRRRRPAHFIAFTRAFDFDNPSTQVCHQTRCMRAR